MQGSKDMWPATIHFLLIFGIVSPIFRPRILEFPHFQAKNSRILPFSGLEFPLLPVTELILIIGPIQRKLQNHGSLFFLFCCFGSYFNCGFAGLYNPFREVAPYVFKKILSSTNAPRGVCGSAQCPILPPATVAFSVYEWQVYYWSCSM